MVKSRSRRDRGPRLAPRAAAERRHVRTAPSLVIVAIGVAGLLASVCASAVLVLDHLLGIAVPGCGAGSPCAEAAASAWGRLPLLRWPTSCFGLAYFVTALVVWIWERGRLTALLRYVVRIGVFGSAVLTVAMLVEKHVCPYCLTAHLGNLLFWLATERHRHVEGARPRAVGTAVAVFACVTAALAVADRMQWKARHERGERQLNESITEIIAATTQRAGASGGGSSGRRAASAPVDTAPLATQRAATEPAESQPTTTAAKPIFTGRYRWGPEAAPIRIVMFTDYQCVDCNRIEREIRPLLQRSDLSLAIKYFPMCTDCNPRFQVNKHPNACWAARTAETAGILRGNDGFWEMHQWLFDRQGSFTQAELRAGLLELGYDVAEFERLLLGPETLHRVQTDIDEALSLGLHFTPMVFINGVEFKGWFANDAVVRAVERIAATNPPALTAEHDHPVAATEKYLQDWREQPVRRMPPDNRSWTLGPDDAKVDVVLWGDYQEPYTAQADDIIRSFVAARSDARYAFRHYPVNPSCNPASQVTKHPLACRAAQAAEAAGTLGGHDGYWRMHAWLMANQSRFSDETLRAAAAEMGLDPDAFFQAMQQPEISAAITEDGQAGKNLGLRSVPMIYVNGQFVPRWSREGDPILERLLAEASTGN